VRWREEKFQPGDNLSPGWNTGGSYAAGITGSGSAGAEGEDFDSLGHGGNRSCSESVLESVCRHGDLDHSKSS
jgi:hypothetical protein